MNQLCLEYPRALLAELSCPAEIVHSIPGRVRLKLSPVDAHQGPAFSAQLLQNPDVTGATWSALSRSLTVTYRSALPVWKLDEALPLRPAAAPASADRFAAAAGAALSVALAASAAELPLTLVAGLVGGKGARKLTSSVLMQVAELAFSLFLGEIGAALLAAALGALLARRARPRSRPAPTRRVLALAA